MSKKEYRKHSKSEVYIPTFNVEQSGKMDIPVNSDLWGVAELVKKLGVAEEK